jgi:hypothetical protein
MQSVSKILLQLVKALGYVMHLFPKLKHFDIMYEALIDGPTPVLKDLDKEFDTVISWGRACPSLCTCRLPSKFPICTYEVILGE